MAPSPRRAPAGIPAALDDSLGLLAGGVAPASGITRVDKNLVVPQRGRPGTWRPLDTVRAFATERLQAASEEAHARERHLPGFATHAADLAQPIGGQWRHHLGVAGSDLRAALAACPPAS